MGTKQSFPQVLLPRETIVIVTGGNTGIGYETAKAIAMMGATVIIACRSKERAQQAIDKMNEEFKDGKNNGQTGIISDDKLSLEFMKLDLKSLTSTMEFIEAFKSSERKLHRLICNAGIAFVDQGYTEDEYENMFQTNYLGHFLITAHFLPIMKASGDDCRIIFVSSGAHKFADFNLDTAQARDVKSFNRLAYYGKSKLYQIMQMYSMSRRLKNHDVTVNSLHPGVVRTDFVKNVTSSKYLAAIRFQRFLGIGSTPAEGAVTTINCAVNPELAGVTDVYFDDCTPQTPSSAARNVQFQEELWTYTLKCLDKYLPEHILKDLGDP